MEESRRRRRRAIEENPSLFSITQRTLQPNNSLLHSPFPLPHDHHHSNLPLEFSRLSLAFPASHHPPAPELPRGNYWGPGYQREGGFGNVGLVRGNGSGCFLGGSQGDFLVGPGSGGGFGGGFEERLNFDNGFGERLNFDNGFGERLNFDGGFGGRLNFDNGFGERLNFDGGFGERLNFDGGFGGRLNFEGGFGRGGGYGEGGGLLFGENGVEFLCRNRSLTWRNEGVGFSRFCENGGFVEDLVPRKGEYVGESLCELKNLRGGFRMRDFGGMIVMLAKDQSWSKALQSKIEEQSVEENEFVVAEVVDFVCDLMKNQSGSYFIQKLFGVCNEEQRTRIIVAASRVSFDLVNVCLCSHGAKTVQILMENLNTPQQISLVISAICPGAVVLSSDQHGQHVIRCCLTKFSYEFHKLLLDKIIQNCIQVATNKCGCCVLQSCVEYSQGKPRKRLIDEIIANAIRLAQDPYGNYVVQHLAGLGVPEITAGLIQHLRGKFTSLSCNKFASNVVEKFLLEAREEYTTTIIEDLLENPQAAAALLVNPYGNFVIQTALTVSKGVVFEKLLSLILQHAPSIRNNTYGEKIFAWFKKRNISLDKYMKN